MDPLQQPVRRIPTPQGWSPDPWNPVSLRWWDGCVWTGHTSPWDNPIASVGVIAPDRHQGVPELPEDEADLLLEGHYWKTGFIAMLVLSFCTLSLVPPRYVLYLPSTSR